MGEGAAAMARRHGGQRLLVSLVIVLCLEWSAGGSNSSEGLCSILAAHTAERVPAGCAEPNATCSSSTDISACIDARTGCRLGWGVQAGLAAVEKCAPASQGCALTACLGGEASCHGALLAARRQASSDGGDISYWGFCPPSVDAGGSDVPLAPAGNPTCAFLVQSGLGAAWGNFSVSDAQCGPLPGGAAFTCERGLLVGLVGGSGGRVQRAFQVRQVAACSGAAADEGYAWLQECVEVETSVEAETSAEPETTTTPLQATAAPIANGTAAEAMSTSTAEQVSSTPAPDDRELEPEELLNSTVVVQKNITIVNVTTVEVQYVQNASSNGEGLGAQLASLVLSALCPPRPAAPFRGLVVLPRRHWPSCVCPGPWRRAPRLRRSAGPCRWGHSRT